MEITSFILGVLAVIAIMMVVMASVNYMAIKTLKLQCDNLDKYANRIEQEINQRVSTEIQTLDSSLSTLESMYLTISLSSLLAR